MKTAVLSMCSNKTLNKNQNFPNALLGWHRKCQSFQPWHIQKNFWGNSSPCYTTNLCQPVLNQSPKYTPLNFTSLGLRLSSHTSLFWTLPGLLSMLHHAPVPTPSWTYLLKIHDKTSDCKIFISHICFELYRNSFPCYTTHVSQPILNQRPKTHYKLQIRFFHLTHPCFELCRNSSPCYTTHVSQPILYQRPKIHHKRLMTQFCFVIPSTSNLPRYTSQISMFTI